MAAAADAPREPLRMHLLAWGPSNPEMSRRPPDADEAGATVNLTGELVRVFFGSRSAAPPSREHFAKANVFAANGVIALNSTIWLCILGSVFDAFLYIISGRSNEAVGVCASAVGVTQLLVLWPIASTVDRVSDRGKAARAASLMYLVFAAVFAAAVFRRSLLLVLLSLAVFATAAELATSVSNCVFADSVAAPRRAAALGRQNVARMLAAAAGTLAVVLFFVLAGNRWTIALCQAVLAGGATVAAVASASLLWLMTDPRAAAGVGAVAAAAGGGGAAAAGGGGAAAGMLPVEGASYGFAAAVGAAPGTGEIVGAPVPGDVEAPAAADSAAAAGSGAAGNLNAFGAVAASGAFGAVGASGSAASAFSTAPSSYDALLAGSAPLFEETEVPPPPRSPHASIPFNVIAAAFCRACGAGMTMRFFNLYFINEFQFLPVAVSVVAAATMLATAVFTRVAVACAAAVGNGPAAVLFNASGALLLYLLILNDRSPVPFVVLHLLRNGVQNGVASVEQTIVLNTTKSANRGKWTAAQSVLNVCWYGSAAIGGRISDTMGYRASFLATLGFYVATTVILVPVAFMYPKSAEPTRDTDAGDPTTVPLLYGMPKARPDGGEVGNEKLHAVAGAPGNGPI